MTENIDTNININFDSLLKLGFAVIDIRCKDYEISTETFKYVIAFVEHDREDFYKNMIKEYLGKEFKGKDIYDMWIKILKHKIKLSRKLERDISIKVAAIDLIESEE